MITVTPPGFADGQSKNKIAFTAGRRNAEA